MITITLGKKTFLTLLAIVSLYASYKFGYKRGWDKAFDAIEAYMNASKPQADGQPGTLDHSKESTKS